MFRKTMYAFLAVCFCIQISLGQDLGFSASPVESFISAFSSAVHASKTLPEIFDLSGLSPSAFSKSLFDSAYADSVQLGHGNPYHIASTLTMPVNEVIDPFSLPLMVDINGNAIAKYLHSKGVLNSSNAAALAVQYANTMEDTANRSFVKSTPESKFVVLSDGLRRFMTSLDQHKVDTIEDLALHFAREVKRLGAH